ncbi:hypothetical protein Tco_0053998 [Tanacetum coccineum]
MTKDEQVLHDDLEKMIAQEVVAKALDDATRQAFEEEKRNIASQKRTAQATSTNKLSTVRSSVSTATTPYVSAASTPKSANAGESSFVYLGGQIPIDASTLPNVDLPTDPNMPDLEDVSNAFPNYGIFIGAYDDDDVGVVLENDSDNIEHEVDPLFSNLGMDYDVVGLNESFDSQKMLEFLVEVDRYKLIDEDDLVDVLFNEELDTRDENEVVVDVDVED